MNLDFSLRRAGEADFEFLYSLKVACLKGYIAATWGWDDTFQENYFANHFDPADTQILVIEGRDVGQFSLEDREDELVLSELYILPRYQRRGLGTAVIQKVLEEGRSSNRPVSLQVLKVNPARRLYERLGFAVVAENETHYFMRTY